MIAPETSAGRVAGVLAELDLAAWGRDGFLHLPAVYDSAEVAELRSWVEEVSHRAPGGRGLLQHYERTTHGPVIARTERLVEAHDGFGSLLVDGLLPAIAGALLGEPAVLYKEKINHKLAGGAGFAPHQDAPAYPFIDTHVSGMVAIDDATTANGCLEVVAGRHHELLPLDERGCIAAAVAVELDWSPVPTRAGDLLWFHSRAPHRSGPNRSTTTRRALFCTYNAASDGDLRQRYYDDKARVFAAEGADSATLSLIGDFEGVAPTDDELRSIGVHP